MCLIINLAFYLKHYIFCLNRHSCQVDMKRCHLINKEEAFKYCSPKAFFSLCHPPQGAAGPLGSSGPSQRAASCAMLVATPASTTSSNSSALAAQAWCRAALQAGSHCLQAPALPLESKFMSWVSYRAASPAGRVGQVDTHTAPGVLGLKTLKQSRVCICNTSLVLIVPTSLA